MIKRIIVDYFYNFNTVQPDIKTTPIPYGKCTEWVEVVCPKRKGWKAVWVFLFSIKECRADMAWGPGKQPEYGRYGKPKQRPRVG
jgi:hypothetical protein